MRISSPATKHRTSKMMRTISYSPLSRLNRRHVTELAHFYSTSSSVEVLVAEQKAIRETALAEAMAREEEALAKERALRELRSQISSSVSALNRTPIKLIEERMIALQSQLNTLDSTKTRSLSEQMETFFNENMVIPNLERQGLDDFKTLAAQKENVSSSGLIAQSIKSTTTGAFVSQYPHLKPTPDYKSYSSQELFLRQMAFTRNSGRLGSLSQGTYLPEDDTRRPKCVGEVTIATLMAAGCHLGHAKAMWRPSTQAYISGEYEGIHLIDLNETLSSLKRAARVVEGVTEKGGVILYVGTTRLGEQQRSLEEAAKRSGGYYVSHRWIPGTITNFTEVIKQIAGEQELEIDLGDAPTGRKLNINDKSLIKPDLVILLNPIDNRNCIQECIKLRIPTIALCDTNMEPSLVTYPIPCNDDSTRASSLIVGALSRAAESGVRKRRDAFVRYQSQKTQNSPL